MGSFQDDVSPIMKSCKTKDELDGFRKNIKNKLQRFLCSPSSLSPTSPPTETLEFVPVKTALNAAGPSTLNQIKKQDDDDAYSFTSSKRGLAVIINNEVFHDPKQFEKRSGTERDAAALEETLTGIGFDVLMENNLTSTQMTCVLTSAAIDYEHADADCFVCVVMSHGDVMWFERGGTFNKKMERNDVIFGVDGLPVKTKFIIDTFNNWNCPSLKDKPRLFFFQACRGEKLDHGTEIPLLKDLQISLRTITSSSVSCCSNNGYLLTNDSLVMKNGKDETDSKPETYNGTKPNQQDILPQFSSPQLPVPPPSLYEDCLVMYATPPGYASWRREDGSWFIQSLCHVLNSPQVGSGKVSLLRALTQVSGLVALKYETYSEEDPSCHEKKQQPVIYSMLIKDVFLRRVPMGARTINYGVSEKVFNGCNEELRSSVY
ncbi:caspase-3, partial [Biomphalaria pfeifferi]